MDEETVLLLFEVDQIRCALPLRNVKRVALAAAMTPLPNAPNAVAGLINVHGELMPVMNIRRRLGLPEKEISLEDRFIISRSEKREMALWVERVYGVESRPAKCRDNIHSVLEKLPHLSGVTAIDDELVLIHDLENFLSDEDEKQLALAMEEVAS